MKYDLVGWFFLAILTVGIVGYAIYVIYATLSTSIRKEDVKEKWEFWINIFWTNTAMGWMWRELFGKKKAKQAPPHFTMGSNSMYINQPLPQPTAFNTSSLNVPHMNHIGKPLVIKNWDRLAGMATMVFGRRWIVVQAFYASSYEFTLQTGGMTKSVTFSIYGDMYDSHRVSVYCQGRTEIMDVGICKDPNRLLHEVTYTFNEKFR
jgi:hypothetical protein